MLRRCFWIASLGFACGIVTLAAAGPTSLELLGQIGAAGERRRSTASRSAGSPAWPSTPASGQYLRPLRRPQRERAGAFLPAGDRVSRRRTPGPCSRRHVPRTGRPSRARRRWSRQGRRALSPPQPRSRGHRARQRPDLHLLGGRGRRSAWRRSSPSSTSTGRFVRELPLPERYRPAVGARSGRAREPRLRVARALSRTAATSSRGRRERTGAGEPGGGAGRRRASRVCCAGISTQGGAPRGVSLSRRRRSAGRRRRRPT